MLRHRSLVMIFSDLLGDETETINALHRLRHGGHDVILFHILDEAEVTFPFHGHCQLHDPETGDEVKVNADGFRREYQQAVEDFRQRMTSECHKSGVDYVALDTSMQFDTALLEYLHSRKTRF